MSSEDYIKPFKEDLIPVEGREGWFRDPDSNAIVNCNKSEYDNYMAAYKRRETKEKKMTTLQDEVNDLKSDVSDIKKLLIDFIKENK